MISFHGLIAILKVNQKLCYWKVMGGFVLGEQKNHTQRNRKHALKWIKDVWWIDTFIRKCIHWNTVKNIKCSVTHQISIISGDESCFSIASWFAVPHGHLKKKGGKKGMKACCVLRLYNPLLHVSLPVAANREESVSE